MNIFYKFIEIIIKETKTVKGLQAIDDLVEGMLIKNELTNSEYKNLQYELNKKLLELVMEERRKKNTK